MKVFTYKRIFGSPPEDVVIHFVSSDRDTGLEIFPLCYQYEIDQKPTIYLITTSAHEIWCASTMAIARPHYKVRSPVCQLMKLCFQACPAFTFLDFLQDYCKENTPTEIVISVPFSSPSLLVLTPFVNLNPIIIVLFL